MHRLIAERLVAQPEMVIPKALDNLRRWTDGACLSGAYAEWHAILVGKKPEEIAALLVSEDEDAVRLRQSSPFAGVLDAREVWKIKRSHETA